MAPNAVNAGWVAPVGCFEPTGVAKPGGNLRGQDSLIAFERLCYDNLDRVIQRKRYDTTASGSLILRNDLKHDDRDRVYQTIRYEVDPATGAVGHSLTGNIWHDAAENVIKSLAAGSKLFTKTEEI